MKRTSTLMALVVAFLLAVPAPAKPDEMPWVQVAKDKKGVVVEPSGRPFVPWSFNYDHDSKGRLIEDYWDNEWPTVEAHFRLMKKLGPTSFASTCSLASSWTARTRPTRRR